MYAYRDPGGATRAAVVAVAFYLAAESAFGLLTLAMLVSPDAFYESGMAVPIAGAVALAVMAAMLASVVFVGRWTYRVNANAHALSGDLTITPGWAVGWHFVPIANLFKPFQAMKETWMASHYRGGWDGEPTPPLLGWWWGLWIFTNFLANISFRMQMSEEMAASDAVLTIDLVTAVLNVPLCLLLIRMMRRLASAQQTALHDETFA